MKKGKLELLKYADNTTLADLLSETEAFVSSQSNKSVRCRMCGECCNREPVLGLDMKLLSRREGMELKDWAAARLMPAEFPDLDARKKLIGEFRRQTGISELEATVLYEYNQSEPLSFRQDERERCFYQQGNLCSNYENRPFVCRLYLCRFGEKLQDLLEMIVTQGTWHAYSLLGAVPEQEIAHNPFLRAQSYADAKLRDFEYCFDKAIGELFSYF